MRNTPRNQSLSAMLAVFGHFAGKYIHSQTGNENSEAYAATFMGFIGSRLIASIIDGDNPIDIRDPGFLGGCVSVGVLSMLLQEVLELPDELSIVIASMAVCALCYIAESWNEYLEEHDEEDVQLLRFLC